MSTSTPMPPPRQVMLPPGYVAEVVTYLEMHAAPPARDLAPRPDLALARVRPGPEGYRRRFREVGAAWLWATRLRLDDAGLAGIVEHADVEIYDLAAQGRFIGILELDFRAPPDCELAFFGVVADAIGSGAGRYLMRAAIARAWSRTPRIGRFFVHTCSNDHPGALAFYIGAGFRPYQRAVEIYPDPRLDGTLATTDAPQIPLL